MPIDPNLLGTYVRRFLLEELVTDRNLSPNTQRSYRDAIRLLFLYIATHHGCDPTQVTVESVSAEIVRNFLSHMENERGNTTATRNQRLAALHSLFGFIGRQAPEFVAHAAQIKAIPLRRTVTPTMPYLDKPEMDAILAVPDRQRPQGCRDYALLLFLYNTGARASEAASITLEDLTLTPPSSARLFGKGRKPRLCPLWPHTCDVLRELLKTRSAVLPYASVFVNVRGQPITRYGIYALVTRTSQKAAEDTPSLKAKLVSPHTIRHTTAVHLLRAGVDINTIRAWLGHVSLETTNRYAEIDLKMKADALQTCAVRDDGAEDKRSTSDWRNNTDIMAFLMSL